MFKLPGLPSQKAEAHELADFAELLAWQRNSASNREIIAYLGRIGENAHNEGCDDEDDDNADSLDEVMIEIGRRQESCVAGYPFQLDDTGTVLKYVADESHRADVYRYLLLSTRLNMQSQRNHAGIDGTAILEELSASVLRHYLGGGRAKSLVFGTAQQGTFEDKINGLCREIGEGDCFDNIDEGKADANDDKLDAVAWVPFSDGKPGKLVIFGQCKTGSTWGEQIAQLQPDAFLKRWTRKPFLVNPVRAFCISETARFSKWSGTVLYAGLLFDRCRIVDFCEGLDAALLGRIRQWNEGALNAAKLS